MTQPADAEPSPSNPPSSAVAPLRIAAFRRLWMALIIFNLGHLIQVVASAWLVLELTGSPLWVSLMVGAPTLPLLLLALPAGAAADLLDRRRVLVGSLVVLVVACGGMALTWAMDLITPGRLLALGLLLGVGVAFFNPAWHAMVPALVPQSLVPGAVALNSATGGVATALGPAVGGVLVATVGPGWAFVTATAGYVSILVAVLTTPSEQWERERGSMFVAIATGIRYLRFSDGYLWLLLLGCFFGFSSAALRAMLPNITNDVLGGDSALYGLLLGAFGAGAIVGGVTFNSAGRRLGGHLLPVTIIGFGICGVGVGMAGGVTVALVGVLVSGVLWAWILSTLNSTFQMLTPDWVRGRTMGAFVLSVFGFLPLGAVAAGLLGDEVGAGGSLVAFSVAVAVTGVVAFRMPLPVLGQIEPPVVPGPGDGGAPESSASPSPVMVLTTWTIEAGEHDHFVGVLADLRRLRLTTGAYQWSAYRNADDARQICEVYMLHSWGDHIQQHRRLDTRGLETIRRAEQFGHSSERTTRHLISFDLDEP